MNATEFKKWLTGHLAAFPSIDRQLADIDEKPGPDGATISRESILKSWKETLKEVSLECALAATRKLAKGDPEYPKWLEDHPRMVLEVGRRLSNNPAPPGPRLVAIGNGEYEDSFECQICRDVGYLSVFSPEAMQAMAQGKFQLKHPPIPRYQVCVVRCSCKWGDYFARSFAAVYVPDRMVKFEGSNTPQEADVEALRAFCEARMTQEAF